jgi:hypothetical protein
VCGIGSWRTSSLEGAWTLHGNCDSSHGDDRTKCQKRACITTDSPCWVGSGRLCERYFRGRRVNGLLVRVGYAETD